MGFTWAYLQRRDVRLASEFANRAAGINCCLRGIEGVARVGELLSRDDRERFLDPRT